METQNDNLELMSRVSAISHDPDIGALFLQKLTALKMNGGGGTDELTQLVESFENRTVLDGQEVPVPDPLPVAGE